MISPKLSQVIKNYEVLDPEEQRLLISQTQEGDLESRDQLILTNLRLVLKIAKEFACPVSLELDDLVLEGIIAIDYSIKKYDLQKQIKPASFFARAIRWRIKSLINKHQNPAIYLNESTNPYQVDSPEFVDLLECTKGQELQRQWENLQDLEYFFTFLNEQEQIVLILSLGLFGFDVYTARSIQHILNRTPPAITNIRDRAINRLQAIVLDPQGVDRYPMIDLEWLEKTVKDKKLISKAEKRRQPQKRRKGMHKTLDLTPVKHPFTFKKGTSPEPFMKKYGDSIVADYKLGCNKSALARKYRCPHSAILKILDSASLD